MDRRSFRTGLLGLPGIASKSDSCNWPIEMEVDMATTNVSLPDPMEEWVEVQAEAGRYANASDYVRDLIRRDQERNDKIAAMQRFVDDGLKSDTGNRSRNALFAEAVKRAEMSRGNG